MSTTETSIIERRLELTAPPERVWRAITDPQEIAQWFGQGAELELRAGGPGHFEWDSHGRFAVRVEAFEPPTRLVWRWMHEAGAPFDEGASTLVEWALTPRGGGGTILDVRESDFKTEGWAAELAELVAFLGD